MNVNLGQHALEFLSVQAEEKECEVSIYTTDRIVE